MNFDKKGLASRPVVPVSSTTCSRSSCNQLGHPASEEGIITLPVSAFKPRVEWGLAKVLQLVCCLLRLWLRMAADPLLPKDPLNRSPIALFTNDERDCCETNICKQVSPPFMLDFKEALMAHLGIRQKQGNEPQPKGTEKILDPRSSWINGHLESFWRSQASLGYEH